MAQTDLIIPDSTAHENPRLSTLAVIPARLASTRLPRKVLREIAGQPMLAWVYQAALACPVLDRIIVATDSGEVAALCRDRGWPCRLTSPDLPSGSDRVQAVAEEIPADIYVNIQADEPLLQPGHLTALLYPFRNPNVEVSTLRVLCPPGERSDPNTVKVVSANDGRALYFSRATIPFERDSNPGGTPPEIWKHLGLYAYRAAALRRFTELPVGSLERTERLEQLRFLENNIALHVATTALDTIGVDTEDDLMKVRAILAQHTPLNR